jgi:outer membrane biosynthesis protein TonB
MRAETSIYSSTLSFDDRSRTRRIWIVSLALALLLHVLLLLLQPPWHSPMSMPRVDVKPIDPKTLEKIRESWKAKEKDLLIGKKDAKNEESAPKDAKYFSDKNTKVEKEQRASVTNVVPKTGGIPQTGATEPEQTKPGTRKSKLSDLGVPLNLNKVAPPKMPRGRQYVPEGGDQSLVDKELPQGSENMLNTEQSVYYSFYSRLYESVGPIWQSNVRRSQPGRKLGPGDYVAIVDVIFDREGNLLKIKYLQSSGISVFDSAVENSWHRISRFPNPPHDLLDKNGQVHTLWNFTVSVGNGVGIEYMPPEWIN